MTPYSPLHIVSGLLIWCVWFVLLYGGLSVLCHVILDPGAEQSVMVIRVMLTGLTLFTVALLLALALRCWRLWRRDAGGDRQKEIFLWLSMAGQIIAAAAALAVGMPLLFLPPCL